LTLNTGNKNTHTKWIDSIKYLYYTTKKALDCIILVTCDGYPQQDENSVGFQLLSDPQACVFKQLISQDTGLILKYYTLPTCQLEPLCRDNYSPLFQQITCQEDGRYSYPMTICLPNN
jgi:hypothetical protein